MSLKKIFGLSPLETLENSKNITKKAKTLWEELKKREGLFPGFSDEAPDKTPSKLQDPKISPKSSPTAPNIEETPLFDPLAVEVAKKLSLPVLVKRIPRKRGMTFSFQPSGYLKILCNNSVDFAASSNEILKVQPWILKQQKFWLEQKELFPPILWDEGEQIPFMGSTYTFKIMESKNIQYLKFSDANHTITLCKKPSWTKAKQIKFIKSKFKEKASNQLKERLQYWSSEMQLYPDQVYFKDLKATWGLCSKSKKTISLNWKLIVFEQEIQDGVIIHELSHLKHAHHQKSFWDHVLKYQPDHNKWRKSLKNRAFLCDFLSNKPQWDNFPVDCYIPPVSY